MTRKIRKHRLQYPHFRAKVDVIFSKSLSIAEMEEYLPELYPGILIEEGEPNVNAVALTVGPSEVSPILLLITASSTLSDIHHEVIHITSFMFNSIGETHTLQNDEFYAYTSTAIYEDIIELVENKFKSKIPFPTK